MAENGENPFEMLKKYQRIMLIGMKEHLEKIKKIGLNKKIVVVGTKCCKNCERLNGAKYTGKEALHKMPLPNPQCTNDVNGNSWCTCLYTFESMLDKEPPLNKKGCLGMFIPVIFIIVLLVGLFTKI